MGKYLKMNDNYKIYLCGITANEYKDIDKLTKDTHQYFDGLSWVVDSASIDGTKELLESRKGCGKIISAPFYKQHSHQMNNYMYGGNIEIGSWVFLRDSKERFNIDFVKRIRTFCDNLNKEKIQTVFSHGKGFAFRYYDDMFFHGSPHWGLQNFRAQVIDLKDYFEKEEDYAFRLWDGMEGGRPFDNAINHLCKYTFTYGQSNALAPYYQGDEFRNKEAARVQFRYHCYFQYNSDFSLDSLTSILEKGDWKSDEKFIDLMEELKFVKNFYRYRILKQDFDEIIKSENEWSLKEYLK